MGGKVTLMTYFIQTSFHGILFSKLFLSFLISSCSALQCWESCSQAKAPTGSSQGREGGTEPTAVPSNGQHRPKKESGGTGQSRVSRGNKGFGKSLCLFLHRVEGSPGNDPSADQNFFLTLFSVFQSIHLKLPFAKPGLSTLFPATEYTCLRLGSPTCSLPEFQNPLVEGTSWESAEPWAAMVPRPKNKELEPPHCKPIKWHLPKEAWIHFINQIGAAPPQPDRQFVFGITALPDFANMDVYYAQGTTNFKW